LISGDKAPYPFADACSLSCERENGEFDELFRLCSGLPVGTGLGEEAHLISFLPENFQGIRFGNVVFPVTFKGVLCNPFDNKAVIYLSVSYDRHLKETKGGIGYYERFLKVMFCVLLAKYNYPDLKDLDDPNIELMDQGAYASAWRALQAGKIGWTLSEGEDPKALWQFLITRGKIVTPMLKSMD